MKKYVLSRSPFSAAAAFAAVLLLPASTRADGPAYEKDFLPIVQQFCMPCHDAEHIKGDLDLERFKSDKDVVDSIAIWQRIAKRVESKEMPPRKSPQPTDEEKQKMLAWIAAQGLELPTDTRVCLLTLPRIAGYLFNPVSFYFCFDTAGAPVAAVAEVGNTFGEMKPYLLRGEELTNGEVFRRIVPKHFYVSPFSSLDLSFDFKLRVPGNSLEIHIDDRAGEQRVLLSALTGKRAALTDANLARFTVKYPLLTLKVIFLIHWQALLLWWKKIPWHRKSANAAQQRDVLNPHPSIARKLS